MVEGPNKKPIPRKGNTKTLWLAFGFLCAAMISLIVANIIVRFPSGNGTDPETEKEKFTCSQYSEITDIAQCVRDEYEVTAEKEKIGIGACMGICKEYAEAIMARIEADQPVDKYDYIMKIFNAYTLAVNDDASAAGLVFVRNSMLLRLEKSSEHTDELLADAIKSDEVLKTPASADEVIALAYRCGKKEVGEQYLEIKRAREKERGIDSSGGQG